MSAHSIVDYRSEHEGYRCGYCGSPDTNYSCGMWAYQMTVEDYQDLIDRGWRRSGQYTYKPTLTRTCCPMYPIRCAVTNLRLTKSQKKVIRRVNKYLSYDHRPKETSDRPDDDRGNNQKAFSVGAKAVDTRLADARYDAGSRQPDRATATEEHTRNVGTTGSHQGGSHKTLPRPGAGPDPTKPKAKKAKLIRLEKKQAKTAGVTDVGNSESGASNRVHEKVKEGKSNQESKTLEDYLNDVISNPAHKLEIKLVKSASDTHGNVTPTPHAVFKKYQMTVHHEEEFECSRNQYKGFLVDSPLKQPPHLAERGERLPDGFGSFHQQYFLDGRLIAVGVIDILPHCVSSVYLFYDPDYSFLSLGTYSALRELAFTRSLHRLDPAIEYYYLGFYIHSCPKMRYKAQYAPSYLCCPETYKWFPIEDCLPKLDASRYSRFAEAGIEDDDRLRGEDDLNDVLCLYRRKAMPFSVYRSLAGDKADVGEVRQYAELVGRRCAHRLLLTR